MLALRCLCLLVLLAESAMAAQPTQPWSSVSPTAVSRDAAARPAQAGAGTKLALRLHPKHPSSRLDVLPPEALQRYSVVARQSLQFLGRDGPDAPFLLGLPAGIDEAAIADAANALQMLDGVLWVVPIRPANSGPRQAPVERLSNDESANLAVETVSRFRVRFKDPATRGASTLEQRLPTELIERMQRAIVSPIRLVRPMSGGAWVFEFATPLTVADGEAALARLRALAEVESAHLSRRIDIQAWPNDPYFSSSGTVIQTNLLPPATTSPTGTSIPAGTQYYGIDATNAWGITTGSANTVVAVVDTGVLFNHPELSGRLLTGYDFIAHDTDASDPGLSCAQTNATSGWHGTHVAGIIAANANNGVGIAGIDWAAKILPVRVLGQCLNQDEDVIDGMRWAVGLPVPGAPTNPTPARVINMSLGGPGACDSLWQGTIDDVMAAGALVVVAAGNDATSDLYRPASCFGAITVTATDPLGYKASYSNYGTESLVPELSAPGGNTSRYGSTSFGVWSAGNTGTITPLTNAMVSREGTSMATPHVAGIAALVLAVNPSLTPAQLRSVILANLTPFPAYSDFVTNYPRGGRGIANAYLAVTAAQQRTFIPESGWWWNPRESGRGFSIEVSGNNLAMATFLYDASGRATWYLSAGPLNADGSYSGQLSEFTGGQTLTGGYTAPAVKGNVSDVSLSCVTSTSCTLDWAGPTIQIERFIWDESAKPANAPETGWWWNANESGRGYFLEMQGNTLGATAYMYDDSGNALWYLMSGAANGTAIADNWIQFGYGQTLTGGYVSPFMVNDSVGPVVIQFANPASAILTLPDGRQIPIARFVF